jgi:CRISPR-associated endonuclease/helicase Cas3
MPPTSSEALPLPVWSARAWLSGLFSDAVDLEMADAAPGESKADRSALEKSMRWVFVWGGADASGLIRADRLKPGSTIILPSAAGGCDRFGWVPEPSADPVATQDISEAAILRARNRGVVRFHPNVLDAERWTRAEGVLGSLDEDASDAEATGNLLAAFPAFIHDVGADPIAVRYAGTDGPLAGGIALISRSRRKHPANPIAVRPDLLDDDDLAMLALGKVPLISHGNGVGREVDATCAAVGLRDRLRRDTTLGARCHDFGKAEVRFKALMWNEDLMAAVGKMPLAKSLVPQAGEDRWSGSVERVGLPRGARHECWSVVMVDGSPLLDTASDPDLVLWLIGTHHGRGRPFFDPVDDPFPVIEEVVLDVLDDTGQAVRLRAPVRHGLAHVSTGWVDRFDRLIWRYGHWGLAYLEAVVRLSDARRSRAEADMIQGDAEAQGLFAKTEAA